MSFFKEAPFCSWALYRYAATLAGGLRAFGKEERGSRLPKRQVGWSGGLQVWEDAAVSAGSGFGLPFSMAAPCGTAYCSPVVSACSHEIIFSKHLTLNYRPSLAGWKQLTHCIYLDQLKKKKPKPQLISAAHFYKAKHLHCAVTWDLTLKRRMVSFPTCLLIQVFTVLLSLRAGDL